MLLFGLSLLFLEAAAATNDGQAHENNILNNRQD